MPVETTAVTLGLFTQLILGDPNFSTELVSALPQIPHQAFESIIPLPTNPLEKQPYKNAELLYYSLPFETERNLDLEQNLASMGPLMGIMNDKLLAVEQKIALGLQETYTTVLDEVDQSTLRQLYTIGKWMVDRCAPLIRPRLIEGKFVTFNDQGLYAQASKMAYHQLWSIKQAILVHQLYALELKRGVFTGQSLQLPQIGNEITAKNSLVQLWQLRWNESRQVAELIFHLQQYQLIWQTLLNDNAFKEDMTGQVALKKYAYLVENYQVADLMGELQAAYFNFMLSTKIQSGFSRYIEWSLSYAATKIARLTGPIKEARDWQIVKKEAADYIALNRAQLPTPSTAEGDQNIAFQQYFEAVRQDQFIYANWLGQTLKGQNSSFNWTQEAEDFENYQRKINHLLDAYQFAHQMIANLTKLQGEIFGSIQSNGPTLSNKDLIFLDFSGSQTQIKEVFLLLRKIEELRILMRLGYLKKIRSEFNSLEKEIIERFLNSLLNKFKRFATTGIVFDPTMSYEAVVQENFAQLIEGFNSLLTGYELYLKSLANKIEVRDYRQEAQAKKEKFNNEERFYPVFFNYQELIKFIRQEDYSHPMLTIFIYNLKHQTDLTFLPEDIVETFILQIQKLSKCQFDLLGLENDFKRPSFSLNLQAQKTWLTAKQSCDKIIKKTIDSFEKSIISSNNQQEPLTVERVLGSTIRKVNRFFSEGVIVDSTDEYPSIIKSVNTTIKNLNKSIAQIIQGLEEGKLQAVSTQQETCFRGINIVENYME